MIEVTERPYTGVESTEETTSLKKDGKSVWEAVCVRLYIYFINMPKVAATKPVRVLSFNIY